MLKAILTEIGLKTGGKLRGICLGVHHASRIMGIQMLGRSTPVSPRFIDATDLGGPVQDLNVYPTLNRWRKLGTNA